MTPESCSFLLLLFLILPEDTFIDFRERGGVRERERQADIHGRQKHRPVASCPLCNEGSKPQPRHVP